jgi:peptide/nickel transport system substrate-binding protein
MSLKNSFVSLNATLSRQRKEIGMKLNHLFNKAASVRIFLVILAMVFTLCVGSAHSAPEPGSIVIVLQDPPESLDPQMTSTSDVGKPLLQNVVETMTELDPNDSSIKPRLATSWKQINPNTWRFSLRKGVKFHDGEEFNAEVAVFNVKRLYNTKKPAHIRDKYLGYLKMKAKALDSYTLEIKTDKAEPILPVLMTMMTISSPKTPFDKWTTHPVGTGPYKFVKYQPGQELLLDRFDGYWGKQPQIKKVRYVFRSESSLRASMVKIGEADLAPNIAVQDANSPDMDYSFSNSETTFLRIGAWEPPLDDRRVRLAMNLAVDRNAMRGSIYSKGVVPATQIIGPSIKGHADLKVWPYDPAKAKELLAEAKKDGAPTDKQIWLMGRIAIHPAAAEELEALSSFWRAIGLNVKVKIMEKGTYMTYRDKPYPKDLAFLCQNMHDNNRGDPVFTAFSKYHSNGKSTGISDPELDKIIEKATVTPQGIERETIWQTAFTRMNLYNISDVPLFHMIGYTRVGKRINFKPTIETNSQVQVQQITFK